MSALFISAAIRIARHPISLPAFDVQREDSIYNIIWIIGASVIVLAVLSFFGLR